jgi:hypothetical protein
MASLPGMDFLYEREEFRIDLNEARYNPQRIAHLG